MLRAVSALYTESQVLALIRRDVSKLFRSSAHCNAVANDQTVLFSDGARASVGSGGQPSAPPPPAPPPLPPPPPPSRPPRPAARAWPAAAAAVAITASLGGVYIYRKFSDGRDELASKSEKEAGAGEGAAEGEPAAVPGGAELLPRHAQFLVVGGGTAAFAAMRAVRSARPDAHVLLVAAEPALPYMRPPLSKEAWREPDLAARAARPEDLTFRQWNGRRRPLLYEPPAFYAPASRLAEGAAGAGVARGWRVARLDVARHEAVLERVGAGAGAGRHTLTYDKCVVATGLRARRTAALGGAAAGGRALALRGVRDAARLAAALEEPGLARVAVVGGGFLASELSASLADRMRASERRVEVVQVFREAAPLAAVLPPYLAHDAARRLRAAGVTLLPHAEVKESRVEGGRAVLRLEATGAPLELEAGVVVECVGSEPEDGVARASGLELDAQRGGILVNAELQARTDVFAAGDVASYHDVALGRRRVEHHDHAVASGRRAGENMLAARPQPYTHQSMFWSDLGPDLGYEAVGIIDSKLETVGVFSADAVSEEAVGAMEEGRERALGAVEEGRERRYERGVVLYVRERRVVGVLLWNLFNRIQLARQVVAQGEFDDLFEVAKLFKLHEDE